MAQSGKVPLRGAVRVPAGPRLDVFPTPLVRIRAAALLHAQSRYVVGSSPASSRRWIAYTARVLSLRSAIGDQISVALLRRVRVPIGDLVKFPTPVKSSQLACSSAIPTRTAWAGRRMSCRRLVGTVERTLALGQAAA
jgi:hypothetical protein